LNQAPIVLILIAFVAITIASLLIGTTPLIFLFFHVSVFLFVFGLHVENARVQEEANPGIENIREPSFWSSPIYNAWLHATDLEAWARYASMISVAATAFFGTLFGMFFAVQLGADFWAIFLGWSFGMFFTCSLALNIATLDYWSKQQAGHTKRSSPESD